MALTERQKVLLKNMREFDEDLARRKKTIRWKIQRLYLLTKVKLGLI